MDVKPRIHLVKKVTSMPMEVEDEVEVMDDSEDDLIVNKSSEDGVKRDYSRGASNPDASLAASFKTEDDDEDVDDLGDDAEEELSLLYEDEDAAKEVQHTKEEMKELNGFEEKAIIKEDNEGKRNSRPKAIVMANLSSESEVVNSEEEKPLVVARRRRSVKVIEDLSKPKRSKSPDAPKEKTSPAQNGNMCTADSIEILPELIPLGNDKSDDNKKSDLQALAESLVEDEYEHDDNVSEVSADEDALPSTFSLGDLAWARVGSAPYWPCVITHDPSDKYTCVRFNNRRKELRREYHVQFFGRVQRAWVEQPNMLKFEGLEAFNELAKNVPNNNKAMKAAFSPKGHIKVSWNEAIKDCLQIENKSPAERLELSKIRAATPTCRKRPRRPSAESLNDSNQPSSKKAKTVFEDAEKLISAIPEHVLEENRRKLKTGFKLFQLAHQIESSKASVLSKMWSSISAAEQRFFQEKAAAFLNKADSEEDSLISEESEAASASVEANHKPLKEKKAAIRTEGMVGLFKKESCCLICEEVSTPDPIYKCKGCQNSYHWTCLGEKADEEQHQSSWKCPECVTGNYKCGLCSKLSSEELGSVVKCMTTSCGRHFHMACLKKHGLWPQARFGPDEKLLQCPAHVCHTCASDNPKDPYMKYNSKLVKCIRCPTAYHSGDYCVAAGTVQITFSQIVCPKHYVPPETKKKVSTHTNASWCFICSKGGSLICCEHCPASFHVECLKIDPPEDKYFCDNCETGRMPLYGELLWVKLGKFRWWPAQVLHPSEVPLNIEKLPHDVGEFPIQFCGSKEYFWMNRGRCFLYEEGDAEKIPGVASGSGLDGAYRRGLVEAAKLFTQYTEARNKRENENAAKGRIGSNCKPPVFNKIKANRPFGDCPVYQADPTDKQVCDCDPKGDNPCGPDTHCINRLLMTECRPATCRAGDRCQNQRFQKRAYPPLKVLRTPNRGWGLFVLSDVKRGDFLIEYVGELITMDEFRRRIEYKIDRKEEQNYYYMGLDTQRMLDAGPRGNIARFMNHSCDPNAETQKWTVNGDTRVGLFALADIKGGTELTFNYQFEAMGDFKKMCLCGAKNCSGFIGEKAKALAKPNGNSSKKKAKVVKKKESLAKVWEDLCFRCFDDGEVLMCDWKSCPKVYHLACLGRDKMPREKWFCPWHHCVECGKPAVSHCIHCPNAYCKSHNDVLQQHKELGSICDEHKDDITDLVKFYRRAGGVQHLATSPNVVQQSTESADTSSTSSPVKSPAVRVKTTLGKENSNSARRDHIRPAPKADNNDLDVRQKTPFMYTCKVDGCGFRTRRTRLLNHYLREHKLDEVAAQKLVPQRVLDNHSRLEKIGCPVCQHLCLPMMLRRHIFNTHSELSNAEVNSLFESVFSTKQVKSLGNSDREALENHPFFSKIDSDGRVMCKAPQCLMKVSSQNIARHWHNYHPSLNRENYQPSLKKLLRMIKEGSDPSQILENDLMATLDPSEDDKVSSSSSSDKTKADKSKRIIRCGQCKFRSSSFVKMREHRTEMNHRTPKKLNQSLRNEHLDRIPCGFGDCDFGTKYASNMKRHRQRRSHFLSESDKIEAFKEVDRDELAKKIEQQHNSTTTDEEDDEVDITIPLSQNLSPSKITDYFKPVPKKTAKKALDMSQEESPHSNGELSGTQHAKSNEKALEQ